MKTIRLSLLVATLIAGPSTQAQTANADTMAHQLFAVLKAKDADAFMALYPNQQQMTRLMGKMVRGMAEEFKKARAEMDSSQSDVESLAGLDTLLMEKLMKKASSEDMTKFKKKYAAEFQEVLTVGETKGIIWSNIKLVNYDLDTANADDPSAARLFGGEGFRALKGVFHFSSGDNIYRIPFGKVMFLPEEGGWYGGEFGNPLSKGEADENVEGEKVADVLEEMKPAKPKTKTKSKTKTTPSKPKTKSNP